MPVGMPSIRPEPMRVGSFGFVLRLVDEAAGDGPQRRLRGGRGPQHILVDALEVLVALELALDLLDEVVGSILAEAE
jgi:hypothetical protein